MRRKLTVKKRIFLSYAVNGALWLTNSIIVMIEVFHASSVLDKLTVIVIGTALLASIMVLANRNQENGDELSQYEFGVATVKTLQVMFIVFALMLIGILILLGAGGEHILLATMSVHQVIRLAEAFLFGTIGLTELLIGIFFCKQERDE